MARFEDRMNDLFGRFLEGFEGGETALWSPALDIAESDQAVTVKVELPGMKPDDIDVSVQGDLLTLSGEKREESEDKREDYYHVERRYGSFRRAIPLPASVDPDKIEARHRDGVLTITLPKSEQAKARKIDVK
jgi:HSP20 family protein